jgi:hypothetical protein
VYAGEDAGCGVLLGSAGGGVAVADGGGPGAGVTAVGGEDHDDVAQLFYRSPSGT